MSAGGLVGFLIGLIGEPALHGGLKPGWNKFSQYVNSKLPTEILGAGELVQLRKKAFIDEARYTLELAKQGIGDDRPELLVKNDEQLLQAADIISLWRRNVYNDDEMKFQLSQLGYTDYKIESIIKASLSIPSFNDVMSFAVRRVYDEGLNTKLGLNEGFEVLSTNAADDIRASGIAPETLAKYWAAHWSMPGLDQGLEMYHRNVIKDEDLDLFYLMSDVMPYWREKLKGIAFNPYSRRDVRMMYKLKIIDETEVLSAYLDMGYDADKAQKMTEFCIKFGDAYNDTEISKDEAKQDKLNDDTVSAIITGYKDYLIDRNTAIELLRSLDYTDIGIEMLIAQADFAMTEKLLTIQKTTAHDAYTRSLWDRNTTIDFLGRLNLPGAQMDALMLEWDIEKQSKPAKPTKAELNTWFEQHLITESEYRAEMAAMGYTQRYIDFYVHIEIQKGAKKNVPSAKPTPSKTSAGTKAS